MFPSLATPTLVSEPNAITQRRMDQRIDVVGLDSEIAIGLSPLPALERPCFSLEQESNNVCRSPRDCYWLCVALLRVRLQMQRTDTPLADGIRVHVERGPEVLRFKSVQHLQQVVRT